MATATSLVSPALHPKPEVFPFSPLPPPPKGCGSNSYRSRRHLFFSPSKSKHSIFISRVASNPPPSTPEKPPEIELEFVAPKAGADGSYPNPMDRTSAISGEKLLRDIMLDNKIELYAAYIIDGMELLNEKTNTEKRYLKKACYCTMLEFQTAYSIQDLNHQNFLTSFCCLVILTCKFVFDFFLNNYRNLNHGGSLVKLL